MKKIYSSKYQSVYYHVDKSLIFVQRTPETEDMADEEYKDEMRALLKNILDRKVQNIVMDEREFNFPVVPELQLWIANEIVPPAVKAGLKKLAFIKSPDLFVNVSVEQAVSEVKVGGFTTKYFDNEADAMAWVKE